MALYCAQVHIDKYSKYVIHKTDPGVKYSRFYKIFFVFNFMTFMVCLLKIDANILQELIWYCLYSLYAIAKMYDKCSSVWWVIFLFRNWAPKKKTLSEFFICTSMMYCILLCLHLWKETKSLGPYLLYSKIYCKLTVAQFWFFLWEWTYLSEWHHRFAKIKHESWIVWSVYFFLTVRKATRLHV